MQAHTSTHMRACVHIEEKEVKLFCSSLRSMNESRDCPRSIKVAWGRMRRSCLSWPLPAHALTCLPISANLHFNWDNLSFSSWSSKSLDLPTWSLEKTEMTTLGSALQPPVGRAAFLLQLLKPYLKFCNMVSPSNYFLWESRKLWPLCFRTVLPDFS